MNKKSHSNFESYSHLILNLDEVGTNLYKFFHKSLFDIKYNFIIFRYLSYSNKEFFRKALFTLNSTNI